MSLKDHLGSRFIFRGWQLISICMGMWSLLQYVPREISVECMRSGEMKVRSIVDGRAGGLPGRVPKLQGVSRFRGGVF